MSQGIKDILSAKLTNHANSKLVKPHDRIFKSDKNGIIELNGISIRIAQSETVKTLADKINAKRNSTKVTAEVITYKNGHKLLLKSKDAQINFNDPKNIFLNHYNKKEFGTYDTSSIQVVRNTATKKSNDVILNYVGSTAQNMQTNKLLSDFNRVFLARQTTNNILSDKLVPAFKITADVEPILQDAQAIDIQAQLLEIDPVELIQNVQDFEPEILQVQAMPVIEEIVHAEAVQNVPVVDNRVSNSVNIVNQALSTFSSYYNLYMEYDYYNTLLVDLSQAVKENPNISSDWLTDPVNQENLAEIISGQMYAKRRTGFLRMWELESFDMTPRNRESLINNIHNLII
jgi:hypothetical protein